MRYLIGFVGAIITIVLLRLLVDFVFNFAISEFMIGWLCCMGYYLARDIYVDCQK
jgi:hypothetical protein